MFFRCFFCTVRLSIFERFVFASFEPLRFCKKVRFVFPDLGCAVERGSPFILWIVKNDAFNI